MFKSTVTTKQINCSLIEHMHNFYIYLFLLVLKRLVVPRGSPYPQFYSVLFTVLLGRKLDHLNDLLRFPSPAFQFLDILPRDQVAVADL